MGMSERLVVIICLCVLASIVSAQTNRPNTRGLDLFEIGRTPERQVHPSAIRVARLQYGGGGDWYWGNSAVPNLLEFIREQTGWPIDDREKRVKIEDENLFKYPFLFATGHGTIAFSDAEIERLRTYLTGGGFLFINDSYGMDKSVRAMVAELFPEAPFQEIPFDHPIYHCFFDFPNGPPKIHEHDNNPPSAWGINIDGRLAVFYLHESDIGDGWEDEHVHNDPPEKRLDALKMGLNIVTYALAF